MNHDIDHDTFDLDDLEALGLSKFDPTQHLTSKAAMAAYMSEIVATGNAELFQSAMNDVVRAYGMGKVDISLPARRPTSAPCCWPS